MNNGNGVEVTQHFRWRRRRRRQREAFPFRAELAEARNTDLTLLVRWLAKPYGEREPIFAVELPDGRPLETGILLRDLYREIVQPSEGPREGEWWQCPTCETWQVKNVP